MSKQVQDAYIVAATRTPVGKAPRGVFRNTRPDDMLAHVLKSVIAQAPGIDVNRIDDAIIGCAMPEGEQGMNVARIGVLLAGLPNTIAAQTINRFCSSGLQAVALAANEIRLGNSDLMLAGGTESMSMVPMMGNKVALSPSVFNDDHVAIAYGMGITAEKVAEEWKISREDQDAFALASHQKAIAAQQAGEFKSEISPYEVISHQPDLSGNLIKLRKSLVELDEGPRPDASLEALAKLKPVFRNGQFGGSVTAGTSSQMSDGAAAVLLASGQAVKDYGLTPLARFVSFSVAGVRPEVMGIGPIAAIPKALKQAGLSKDQIDWIELNEAFAAQALAVIRDSGLDPSKVNPLGGAIALGHPLGATGAIRTATIVHGLQRRKQKYGLVTMCIGTGMGAAGVFESL
ncbi:MULTISPECIES: acetyl-CoA C-acyltransferase [unclassified Lysobacter]|uniref:acetyl-CoA C-acyltransferase n=1 Tax=unclassified Lysobacter TaxID=2635362 RepID=UPI001BED16B8|nr:MULTISPECIES: acetyl-CoA C-acyltransferase [unclassified Lysobacter]MBT2746680.1 acetyl-CoA C-acyltransferase [Lysobacter sp. ISL-42]MBT2751729.1 acetyl-CoA C-acyltransferase [Lysobacter sp. ISL-50]MBT2778081.1 acetyl-CoA C-acyltransferase [Lysobacter sp. ISL-54]MBT2781722.1 acetyl-CoA C-acyltransferase [Lysobacter sp. ISL-52]